MQDQVYAVGKGLNMLAYRLTHPPLDAVAFMRLAQHLAGSQSNAGPGRNGR